MHTGENLVKVFQIANKYEVNHLLKYCEKHLIELMPKEFSVFDSEKLTCFHRIIIDISSELCAVNLEDWLRSTGAVDIMNRIAPYVAWWCAILVLYKLAKDFSLAELKEQSWKRLMDTSSSSVWCSSAGLNSSSAGRVKEGTSFIPLNPMSVQPIHLDESRKEKIRFVLRGLKTYPFFTGLKTEEMKDLLLSFATFQETFTC